MLASTLSCSVGRSDTGSAGSGWATAAGVPGFGTHTGPSLFCRDTISVVLVGDVSDTRRPRVRALMVAAGGESRSTFVVASFEASCGRSNMASTAEGSDFGVRAGPVSAAGSRSGSLLASLMSIFLHVAGRTLGAASAGPVAFSSVLVLFLDRSEVARAEKGRTMAANIVDLCTEGGWEGEGERARGLYRYWITNHSPGPRSGVMVVMVMVVVVVVGRPTLGWDWRGTVRCGTSCLVLSRLSSFDRHCFYSFHFEARFLFEGSEAL